MLRTSGDVSSSRIIVFAKRRYAPHERRCFLYYIGQFDSSTICSARAEMFLYQG